MKHNISCDCPACYERQREADRFLFGIGLGALIVVSAAGYIHSIRAGLFSFLTH